jgi:hypothetical protein
MRWLLVNNSMSWSPLLAVSTQAEEATGRTATPAGVGRAGWVAGAPVAGALVGWPSQRIDPTANPSTIPTASIAARALSSHAHRRRGAGPRTRVPGWGSPPTAGAAVAGAGSSGCSNQPHPCCRRAGPASPRTAWPDSAAASPAASRGGFSARRRGSSTSGRRRSRFLRMISPVAPWTLRVTRRPGRPARRAGCRPWCRHRTARQPGPACRPAP